jgi:hypothetical protein
MGIMEFGFYTTEATSDYTSIYYGVPEIRLNKFAIFIQ